MKYAARIAFALASVAAIALNSQPAVAVSFLCGALAGLEFFLEKHVLVGDIRTELAALSERIDACHELAETKSSAKPADHSADLAEFRQRLDRISIAVGLAHTLPKKVEQA